MSSSDESYGTVNLRRERARELEVLRHNYRQHREGLVRMITDAPSEHLASEYARLVAEIDRAIGKLDELEGLAATAVSPLPMPSQHEPAKPHGDPLRSRTEPGSHPLVNAPAQNAFDETGPPLPGAEPRSRVALILVATLVALGLIGWLIWRASSDRGAERPIVEEEVTATDAPVAEDPQPAEPVAAELGASPESHDYGVVSKGTRATRQFEIANNTEEPMSIQVARSACRCLYYEHAPVIPPRGKETLTVTIDGARAKAGALREQVRISSKSDAAIATTVDVIATVR
jgi:hypothetical protein